MVYNDKIGYYVNPKKHASSIPASSIRPATGRKGGRPVDKMELSALDAYLNRVYKIIVLLIPAYCVCAAASITLMQASGWYPPIDSTLLTLFDASTLVYLAIGIYFIRTGFGADGIVRPDKLRAAKIMMAVIIVIQWNAISYLWPFTDFWAYFLLFTIVEAFFFDPKLVAWTSVGIVVSLVVSWFFGSEMLLPVRDELFAMNLLFRVVGLALMLLSVNAITYLGGKFLVDELEKHANYDPLTHLLNRRSMDSQLQAAHALASAGKADFCLLMLDIDNFKQVNDTFGHDCGDEVLKQIAGIISTSVKKDDRVFRWGGEEILVLLKADEDRAADVAERIRHEVATEKVHYRDEAEVSISVTIGLAPWRDGMSIQALMDDADAKLYYGKRHGKNQVVSALPPTGKDNPSFPRRQRP